MLLGVLIFAVLLPTSTGEQSKEEKRGLEIYRGHSNCSNPRPSILYYYDRKLANCFPFLYKGCGGEKEVYYATENKCLRYGKPADARFCVGNEKPVGHCGGKRKLTCPKGSYCLLGHWGFGNCCDEKKTEEWKEEFNPVCERNKVLMIESVRDPNKKRPLVGRDCSHKFCPEGSECVKGKRLAYCCGVTNPPKGMYPVRREV
ncbi:hypothetical protein Aduo_000411 [Ancylostoma duodenale]